jgi:hypothetical protein
LAAASSVRLTTPLCTTPLRPVGFSSTICFMRANSTITPPRSGTAPPDSPVPAPRATIGSPLARAQRTSLAHVGGGLRVEDGVGLAAVKASVHLEGDQFGGVGDELAAD